MITQVESDVTEIWRDLTQGRRSTVMRAAAAEALRQLGATRLVCTTCFAELAARSLAVTSAHLGPDETVDVVEVVAARGMVFTTAIERRRAISEAARRVSGRLRRRLEDAVATATSPKRGAGWLDPRRWRLCDCVRCHVDADKVVLGLAACYMHRQEKCLARYCESLSAAISA